MRTPSSIFSFGVLRSAWRFRIVPLLMALCAFIPSRALAYDPTHSGYTRSSWANGPLSEPLIITGEFIYAQTPEFWSALEQLDRSQNSVRRLYATLDGRYGQPEETFSTVRVNFSLGDAAWFEARGEGIAWGMTDNPVVSKLHARLVAMGDLSLGAGGPLLGPGSYFGIAGVWGAGAGRKSEGVSSDFIDEFAVNSEDIRLYGLDLTFRKESKPRPSGLIAGVNADFKETVFLSNLSDRFEAHRWKLMTYAGTFRPNETADSSRTHPLTGLTLHAIAGPQPLPKDILPRAWDYVHRTDFFPDLATLVGLGLDLRFPVTRKSSATATFGHYGGEWGGALSMGGFTFATWGIPTQPIAGYQVERIWIGTLSWGF